jgi:hypothetical protein
MTDFLLRSISFIFHPLIMPLLGVMFYFSKTPRFIPQPIIYGKLFSTVILTVILPLLLFYLLKTLGKVNSIYLKTTKERIIPLILNCLIILVVLFRVFPNYEILEIYYFFVGVLCSTMACLILALLKIKASIHTMAASGFFMFAIGIGIHFKININGTIMLTTVILGAIATSRLHLKAHNGAELLIGSFLGFMPQLILLNYWL